MILDKIVEDKKVRLVEHKKNISSSEMKRMADKVQTRNPDSFYHNLKKDGLSIIG